MTMQLEKNTPDALRGAPGTFLRLLDQSVGDARIRFRRNGTEYVAGRRPPEARREPSEVAIRVHGDRFFSRVLAEGNLGLGESYMDGDFEMLEGEIADFLTILLRNRLDEKIRHSWRLVLDVLRIRLVNAFHGRESNIHRHYDAGIDLFEACLDSTMTYSCGYAGSPDDDLEQLQRNKLDRICRKLRLQPGERLLDIGCGYAGLLIHAAKHYGVSGVGVTLSRAHCERGGENVRSAGLADRIRVEYRDFREFQGTFDKVVSVGMFEHVPRREYRLYFGKIAQALQPRGLGLVHVIGCSAPRNVHDAFIQKYIFHDSHQPTLSEMAWHLEQNHLPILDVENLKPHYAHTLRGMAAQVPPEQGLTGSGPVRRQVPSHVGILSVLCHRGVASLRRRAIPGAVREGPYR